MSMTDLKALVLSWFMGARKLPAAPALLFLRKRKSQFFPSSACLFHSFDLFFFSIDLRRGKEEKWEIDFDK